jgi:hypothetical protein
MRTESIKALFPIPDKILRLTDRSLWKVRANVEMYVSDKCFCILFPKVRFRSTRIVIPKSYLFVEILVSSNSLYNLITSHQATTSKRCLSLEGPARRPPAFYLAETEFLDVIGGTKVLKVSSLLFTVTIDGH